MGFTAFPALPSLAQLQGNPQRGISSQPFGFPPMASLCTAATDRVSLPNKRGGGNGGLRKGQSLEKEEFTAS